MSTMTISPIQPVRGDYVTKKGFESFVDDVEDQFDEQKEYMDTGFSKLGEQIDEAEKLMIKGFDSVNQRFIEQKEYIDEGFDKVFSQLDSVESKLGKKIDNLIVSFDKLDTNVGHLTSTINRIADHLKV